MINSLLWLYGIQPNTYVSGQLMDVDSGGGRKNAKLETGLKNEQNPTCRLHAARFVGRGLLAQGESLELILVKKKSNNI
jgi:hypothetical protein